MSYLDTNDAARTWLANFAGGIAHCVKPDVLDSVLDTLPEVHVWPAHMEQAYGGSEEGGWWFDTHAPITDPIREAHAKQTGWPAAPRGARQMRIDQAQAYVRRANALADYFINDQRPSYTSSVSKGVIVWVWTFDPPTNYPRSKPRYE
jgi:hypothetical protein